MDAIFRPTQSCPRGGVAPPRTAQGNYDAERPCAQEHQQAIIMTSTASAPHVIQLGIPIVDNILAFVQANPFLALAILFFLYNKWKGAQSSPHNSLPASLSIPNHICALDSLPYNRIPAVARFWRQHQKGRITC